MKEKNSIHLGIQIVPLAPREKAFPAIDRVIEMISAKGFRFQVTPFETVIECGFEDAIQIIEESAGLMRKEFSGEYLINSRFHIHPGTDVLWDEKVKG